MSRMESLRGSIRREDQLGVNNVVGCRAAADRPDCPPISEDKCGSLSPLVRRRLPKRKTLLDLPSLVIEYILSQLNYYDLLQLRLISRAWHSLIQEYLTKADCNFIYNLSNLQVQWVAVKGQIEDFNQSMIDESSSFDNGFKKKLRTIPKMSPRYHHSACYVGSFMYIFGGCISLNTAYNDLWRLNLTTKKWNRIIAEGTLPLPRLFSSFSLYETRDESTGERRQFLVLLGGLLFDQKLNTTDRVLNTIHLFDIANNRWILVKAKGELDLRLCQHSAVVAGDELIVFSGFRIVNGRDVEAHQVYVFDLKRHVWRLQKTLIPPEVCGGGNTQQRTNNSVFEPNLHTCKRKSSVAPFMLDRHHILYLCDTPTSRNRVSLEAFLLKRARCEESCDLCRGDGSHQKGEETDSTWEWIQVELSRSENDSNDIMHGGEFCKVGEYLAYLSVKNQVSRRHPDVPVLIRDPLCGPVDKHVMRERRMEALEYYSRHFASQHRIVNGMANGGESAEVNTQYMQKMTLQVRLLDISRVLTEKRLYKMPINKVQSNNNEKYSVAPEALACYSLCASPESLILFGGYMINSDNDQTRVSNKLFMILSKPKVQL